jgi:type I restriction enzyme M protein
LAQSLRLLRASLSADLKGDAYEGLLQRNAEDVKGGAGQQLSRFSAEPAKWLRTSFTDALPRYAVTPRPLIAAIVEVVAPQPGQSICDPACGTGGFLLAA